MEERRFDEKASGGTGKCRCYPWPTDQLPSGDDSIRRLLKALEKELEPYADKPTEATKKFGDDLKDADKEYQGIDAIVSKYEEFYDKLECKLAEARTWKEEIDGWCGETEEDNPGTIEAIEKLRNEYEEAEKKGGVCCNWLEERDRLNRRGDCLAQAIRAEEEAKDDNEAYKTFEKTLSDRFGELKSLFDKAKALRAAEKHKSVCAVSLEYADVYNNLNTVVTWEYKRSKCENHRGGRNQGDTEQTETDPKQERPPKQFRDELKQALRTLILAKYQRFHWQQQRLESETKVKKFLEDCKKFRASRRDEFIQEAEDVEAAANDETQTEA